MKSITKLSIFLFAVLAVLSAATFALAQYNYSSPCNYHAYRDCAGSAIYWFDSCSNRQDLYQDCANFNQTCQYGQCVLKYNPAPNPYIAQYKIACSNNDLYWYDSLGAINGLYKNCQDANICTTDSCAGSKCLNTLKCDGSSCALGSADYNTYCPPVQPVVPANLSVSFVAKKDALSNQWDKTVEATQNSSIYFMITVNNNSGSEANNVSVLTNIPSEISFLGNLKVNDIPVSGDMVSGINIGSLAVGASKSITFEGRTQLFDVREQKQAVATVKVGGVALADAITLNFNPSGSVAAVSSPEAGSGIIDFLKRWYLWIFVGLVLIFLFVVVYRRLSSNA